MKYIVRIIRMNTKPPTHPPIIAPIERFDAFAVRKKKVIFYDVRIPKTQVRVFIVIFSFQMMSKRAIFLD
jgi:hypothetical protein